MNLTPTPEFVRINRVREQDGLPGLPSDAELSVTLERAGITHCLGRPYAPLVIASPSSEELAKPMTQRLAEMFEKKADAMEAEVEKTRSHRPLGRASEELRNEKIRAEFRAGKSRVALADEFGLSTSRIGHITVGMRPRWPKKAT